MVSKVNRLILGFFAFLFTAFLLGMVQLKVENPLILAERFFDGGGWFELTLIAFYAGFLMYQMLDPAKTPRWRMISWTLFSLVFFTQLVLGIIADGRFLMTGKLHLPIPAMILAGPIYRGQISIMTILFLSTVVLTGPAWCSQLCYFGAMDGLASQKRAHRGKLKSKMPIKHTLLFVFILITILFKLAGVSTYASTAAGIVFGVGGVLFIVLVSVRKGKMMHCLIYCPIGTIVNYLGRLNPFRIKINMKCTFCESCSNVCRYDALTLSDLTNKKAGPTCTLCGDCLHVCKVNSVQYKLFKFNPQTSRNIYLFLTISIHAVFLALARI